MSDKKSKKRPKSDKSSDISSSDEFGYKKANKNEGLQSESSKSYHTVSEGAASESNIGGLDKPTPSKYQFSRSSVGLAKEVEEEKHVQLLGVVTPPNTVSINDEETNLNRLRSEIAPQNLSELPETKPRMSILKHVIDILTLPKETELHKESSPVKFKSEPELQTESGPVKFIPEAELQKESSPVKLKPVTEGIRPLPENVSSAAQMKKTDSSKMNAGTSSFATNLAMGNAFVYMVIPPDGGYGWFIVLISFITQMIIDGIVFSFGPTLPYIAKDLNVSATKVVLVSATQVAFYYLSGPITSAIINKFGFRKVAMSGAILSSLCLMISTFSPNLEMMIFFYSVLGGSTLSMVWVSSQLIIGYYFEKYRPIASGLSCSGSGVGLFLFNESNSHIVPKLGWRNNTRIQVAYVILTLFLSFAFVEVTPSKIGILRETKELDNASDTSPDEFEVKATNYADPTALKFEEHAVEYLQLKSLPITDTKLFKRNKQNFLTRFCSKFFLCCRRETVQSKRDDGVKRYVIKKDLIDKQDLFYTGPAVYSDRDKSSTREVISGRDVELIEEEIPVEAINYTFSVHDPRRPSLHSSKSRSITTKRCKLGKYIPTKIRNAFLILFDFQLFKILEFQILFLSAFVFALGVNIPFLFSKARTNLSTEKADLIPSIIGASNFASRILSGLIAFSLRRYVAYICGSAITLGGLTILFSAFYGPELFWFQITYAVLFGIAPGFFSTLRAIIYVKYLGLQNLTNAFGLIAMGMGTGVFMGTFLSGLINDISGTYLFSFIFSGICITTSGVLKLIVPTIARRNQKNDKIRTQA